MVHIYDEALIAKLKYWTRKTQVHIFAPSDTGTLFETIADEQKDTIQLPIISLTRQGFEITNVNKRPMSYNGLKIKEEEEFAQQLNAIPISISYQLDIYTRTLKEADMFARDLIFNVINHCKVSIIIPHNGIDYEHHGHVFIGSNVEDNSGVSERLDFGQFTRYTLNLVIDDAYLWSAPFRGYYSITDEGLTIKMTTPGKSTTEEEISFDEEEDNEQN